VTWTVVAGESYNLYVGSSGSSGNKLNTTPLTASPATITGLSNFSYGSGNNIFWLTKVENNVESGKGPTTYVPLLQEPTFSNSYQEPRSSFDGSQFVFSGIYSNYSANISLYTLPSATSSVKDGTLQTSGASWSDLKVTLPFLDGTGAPYIYHMGVVAEYTDGKNFSRSLPKTFDFSPSLQRFKVYPSTTSTFMSDPSAISTYTMTADSLTLYWVCFGGYNLCSTSKVPGISNYPTYSTPGGFGFTIQTVLADSAADDLVHLLINPSGTTNDRVGTYNRKTGSTQTTALITNPVAITQDATYVYVVTATDVKRLTKGQFGAGPLTILTGYTGITAIVADTSGANTVLYVAGTNAATIPQSGIHKITGADLATPSPVASVFWGTTTPVKQLALDASTKMLYFLTESVNPAYDFIVELDTATSPATSSTRVADKVFNALNLQAKNGRLAWGSKKNLYTLTLSSGTLSRRVGEGPTGLLLNTDGSLFTATGGVNNHIVSLPLSYGVTATTPTGPTSGTVTAGDEVLILDSLVGGNADAYEVVYNTTNTWGFMPGNINLQVVKNTTAAGTTPLTNGTSYTVSLKPYSPVGIGTAVSYNPATPKIAAPKVLRLYPLDGGVASVINMLHPRAGKAFNLNLYRNPTSPVPTSGIAVTPWTVTPLTSGWAGYQDFLVNLTGLANGTTVQYLNFTVDEVFSISDPASPSGAELSMNAAAPTTSVTGVTTTNGPSLSAVRLGAYLFWNHATGGLRRLDPTGVTVDTVTNGVVVPYFAADTTNTRLFGLKSMGDTSVWEIQLPARATTGLPITPIALSSYANGITALALDGATSTLYFGTIDGLLYKSDYSAFTGAAPVSPTLVYDTGKVTGEICQLQFHNGFLYYSQDESGYQTCGGYRAIVGRVKVSTQFPQNIVTGSNWGNNFIKFTARTEGSTDVLYLSDSNNNYGIQKFDLTTLPTTPVQTVITPLPVQDFAFHSTGQLFWTNQYSGVYANEQGIVYTLSGTQILGKATGGANTGGYLLIDGNTLYTLGNGTMGSVTVP
ncbi:MAG: hypothetical protein OEW39_11920, partial [Deltaproteobacteria bacterium]|nr:hypothetical protein [Deltaproteobacteria bacterium]